jgi:hypothetical protein
MLSWTATPNLKKGMVTLACEFSTRQATVNASQGAGVKTLGGAMLTLGVDQLSPDIWGMPVSEGCRSCPTSVAAQLQYRG